MVVEENSVTRLGATSEEKKKKKKGKEGVIEIVELKSPKRRTIQIYIYIYLVSSIIEAGKKEGKEKRKEGRREKKVSGGEIPALEKPDDHQADGSSRRG